MKLKRIHILLIIMSLLLLVSIGSVCAEDTANADVQTAADESVDVLADDSSAGESGGDTTPEKINTTVIADDQKVGYDDEKNIPVTVKDNESQVISDVNESSFTVSDDKTPLKFTYNNSIITITDNLTVGLHNITINYLGNSNYTNSSAIIQFKVFGNKTLDVGTTVVVNEDEIVIPVKVFDGVDYLPIAKSDFGDLTLTYTNATGNKTSELISDFRVEDGNIKLTIDDIKLIAASLTIHYTNGTYLNGTVSIKLNTTINAADKEIREDDDKNITVNVLDYKNNPLTITKSDLNVLDNGKAINFEYNNGIITISSLTRGNHTLTIVYKGNETYYTSNKTIVVGIYGNLTIDPQKSAYVDEDKNVEFTLNLSDGVNLITINNEKLNIVLNYIDDEGEHNVTITSFNIDGQTIKFKVDPKFSSAKALLKYEAENNLTGSVTIKVNTTVESENIEFFENQNITINVKVKASNGEYVNLTADRIVVLNGDKAVTTQYNNSVITIKDKLALGIYNLTIKYLGNDTFAESSKIITLNLYGLKTDSAVNVNSSGKVEFNVNVTDGVNSKDITKEDFNLKVDYKNGTVVNITSDEIILNNGTISFTLPDTNFTAITLTVDYKNGNSTKSIALNRIYNVLIIPINVEVDYQDGNFTFKIIDADLEGEVPLVNKTITISGKDTSGNALCWQVWTSQTSLSSYSTSTTVTSDENGIIVLVNKGFAVGLVLPMADDLIDTYASAGDYNLTLTGKNVKGSNSTPIKINQANVNLKIETFNEYYGTTKKVTIVVTNAKTGNPMKGVYITVNMTGATLSNPRQITNSKGKIELGVSTLPPATYKMDLIVNDTNLINKTSPASFTIKKIPVLIFTANVKIYYNSGTTTSIKIIDKRTNKPIANAYVFFKIDSGDTIVGITNKNGVIAFSASLNVGNHKISVTNVYNPEGRDVYQYSPVTRTISVIKASGTFKAPQVKSYYRGGKYFTITLINSKTKKAIFNAKVNVRVYVSSSRYYNYVGYTGGNGQLKLSIDLNPGTYKVEVLGADNKNYAAKKVTSKIVVIKAPTKLTPVKLVSKKGKNNYFKVVVKNIKTKLPIKGVKLKVQVYTGKKYKTYTAVSNAKGIAQLNVKSLSVGTHKVVVSSLNKYCVAKSASSVIRITK